jgi:hypothetical protein
MGIVAPETAGVDGSAPLPTTVFSIGYTNLLK